MRDITKENISEAVIGAYIAYSFNSGLTLIEEIIGVDGDMLYVKSVLGLTKDDWGMGDVDDYTKNMLIAADYLHFADKEDFQYIKQQNLKELISV